MKEKFFIFILMKLVVVIFNHFCLNIYLLKNKPEEKQKFITKTARKNGCNQLSIGTSL
jgi:hypothetical protein